MRKPNPCGVALGGFKSHPTHIPEGEAQSIERIIGAKGGVKMTHLKIAQSKGAKAGFRAYLTNPRLPSHVEGVESLFDEAGVPLNGKPLTSRQEKVLFLTYCERFSDKLAQPSSNGRTIAAASERSEGKKQSLVERLASALGGSNDDEVGVEVEKPATRTRKPAQRRSRRNSGDVGIGTSFTYTGKNGASEWEIVGEGTTRRSKKPAWIAVSTKGREQAWNKKSLALYIEGGKAVIA